MFSLSLYKYMWFKMICWFHLVTVYYYFSREEEEEKKIFHVINSV